MINLVTTALIETFDKKSKNLLLGSWCKIFKDKRISGYDIDLNNTYHWNDRKKLKNDYFYLDSFYEKVLANLCKQLNIYHQTNYSERFWRIVLGPWLALFIHSTFERWENISDLKKKIFYLKQKLSIFYMKILFH